MEDPRRHDLPFMAQPDIPRLTKEREGTTHIRWLQQLDSGTILLHINTFKADDGKTASAWHCLSMRQEDPALLWFERKCQLGNKADIGDGEIHGIQEGLERLLRLGTLQLKGCKVLGK